ncbi:MAG: adenosylcobinamide-GDP ribazoletransferase [Bacteroidales bacterium]|nr:adenosylcobinamide-GDP ribazoletransferase [Bacteroidales bacterium]
MLKNELKIFFTAVMFYTRMPCPKWVEHSPVYLNKTSRYFPLIGWITGTVFFISLYLSLVIFPIEIAVVISMISGILLTGAFHEDGFADVCDGFGGGWKKQRILEIMKDSRIGTYGVIGLALLLLLKFYTLKYIINIAVPNLNNSITLLLIFVSAHSVSRLAAISIVFTHQYIREDEESKAKSVVRNYSWKEVIGSFFFGLVPLICLALYQLQIIYALIPLLFARFMLSGYFKKWIGGYTGDCLGATQQVCEVVYYLSIITIWKFI